MQRLKSFQIWGFQLANMISRIVGALVEPTPVAVEADADSLAIERNLESLVAPEAGEWEIVAFGLRRLELQPLIVRMLGFEPAELATGERVSSYSCDDVVKSSLVDIYWIARSGQKAEAIKLLREMKDKSLYTWTALVTGLIQSGHFVSLYQDSAFHFVRYGKELHCLVSKLGFESEPYISNALVDMYAKCSDIVDAKTMFCSIVKKDVVSWTSIIVGLAQHGKAKEALSLYDDMISNGVKPNEVTFVGLIYACSHVGLVDKGMSVVLFNLNGWCYGDKTSLQLYIRVYWDLYRSSRAFDEVRIAS
ncbi:pentatricopeptide repeat-containing protein [Tanacetum coccineum]